MSDITLQSLIKKQKKRISTLHEMQVGCDYPDMQAYYDWVEIAKRFLRLHFLGDESVVEFCKLCNEPISREQQRRLLAILKAFVKIPIIIKNDIQMNNEKETSIVVNVNNNNCQSQNQSIIIERDKELLEPRSGIMAKLKKVCIAIVTGILVDVLSNPDFWQWLYYHLELILGCILL